MAADTLEPTYRIRSLGIVFSALLFLAIFMTTFYAVVLSLNIDNSITHQLILHVSSSHSATVLRLMIEVVTALLAALVATSLDASLWNLAVSKSGIALPRLLTLSTTTGPIGLVTVGRMWGKSVIALVLTRYTPNLTAIFNILRCSFSGLLYFLFLLF
jgi:hypothetical protein